MRLLMIANNGELCLTEVISADIPRYAILSHTQGNLEGLSTFLMKGIHADYNYFAYP